MKWHKISDGDYPERHKPVLVCMKLLDGYTCDGCFVASMRTYKKGKEYWYDVDVGNITMLFTDRWAYIDLPTD